VDTGSDEDSAGPDADRELEKEVAVR